MTMRFMQNAISDSQRRPTVDNEKNIPYTNHFDMMYNHNHTLMYTNTQCVILLCGIILN